MKTTTNLILQALFATLFLLPAGCEAEKDDLKKPRNFESSVKIDNLDRSYKINLPPQYETGSANFPLVIGLHGTGGSAAQFEKDYQFSVKSDQVGFIAVYPNGVTGDGRFGVRTWNAGTCCDYAMENNINDVKFISTLIDTLIRNYRIDPKRVYLTGMSNGGMMAYRLASEIPQKIAAIAPVSCTMVNRPPATQSTPVPILHIHSLLDKMIPYQGGANSKGYYFPPVDSALKVWVTRNNCQQEAKVMENQGYIRKQWGKDADSSFITHYATKDGGHSWPGGNKARPMADPPSNVINANTLIWDFFQLHKLP